MTPKAVYFAS